MIFRDQLPSPPPPIPPAAERPASPPALPYIAGAATKLETKERVAAIGLCVITLVFTTRCLMIALRFYSADKLIMSVRDTPVIVRVASGLWPLWCGIAVAAGIAALGFAVMGRTRAAILVPAVASIVTFFVALILLSCWYYSIFQFVGSSFSR